MSNKPKLKYLFIAEYSDGELFVQTQEDKSEIEPDTRSAFYDVLNSGKTVVKFTLMEDKLVLAKSVSVDLRTGLFEINGMRVLLEGQKLPGLPKKFDLIYYRQVTQSLNVNYAVDSGDIISSEPQPSFTEYFIGWQCKIRGKNYQQKLAVG